MITLAAILAGVLVACGLYLLLSRNLQRMAIGFSLAFVIGMTIGVAIGSVRWLDETLGEFGRRLGVGEIAFGQRGFVQLALGEGGMLGIAHAPGEVRVWLARPLARSERGA